MAINWADIFPGLTFGLFGATTSGDDVTIPPETQTEIRITAMMTDLNKNWPRQERYMTNRARAVVNAVNQVGIQVLAQLTQAVSRYGDQGWGETPNNLRKSLATKLKDFAAYLDKVNNYPYETIPLPDLKDKAWLILREAKAGVFALEYTRVNASWQWIPDNIYASFDLLGRAVVQLAKTAIQTGTTTIDLIRYAPYLGLGILGLYAYNTLKD